MCVCVCVCVCVCICVCVCVVGGLGSKPPEAKGFSILFPSKMLKKKSGGNNFDSIFAKKPKTLSSINPFQNSRKS